MKYGLRLKEFIKESGINQVELAEKIGVSKSTVSFWVNSEYPPLEGIEKVFKAIERPLYQFFFQEEDLKAILDKLYPQWSELMLSVNNIPLNVQEAMIDSFLKYAKSVEQTFIDAQAKARIKVLEALTPSKSE